MNNSPIILLGTHRSGTTWLGKVFSTHPEIAYWEEPRYVWSWGNNYKPDDVLTAQDASPKITNHIRNRFSKFVDGQGKHHLFEKTPSNCLRVPFIRQIYPQAKILHIIRDGRSVFSSADQLMSSGYFRPNVLSRRLSEMLVETPVWEWPASLNRVSDIVSAKITKNSVKFWGPRPSGWQDWVANEPPNVILAKQWVSTVNKAIEDTQGIASQYYYRLYYEDLVSQPHSIMNKIIDFLELEDTCDFVNKFGESVDPSRQRRWSNLVSDTTLSEIRPYLEPTLKQLDYDW